MSMKSINPANGETVREFPQMEDGDARKAVVTAHKAHLAWKTVPFATRATMMKAAGRVLRENAPRYARIMAEEMGKPVKAGRGEAEKCAWVCDFYAENAESFLSHEEVPIDGTRNFVAFEPIGVVLAVMPWNFPFWQVFRFAAPALMAGNAGLLKHASNVPGCALAIEDVFKQAGFPDGLFRSLLISSGQTKAVLKHKLVSAVTLTGSTGAGRAIGQQAGKLLKKSVLELGGSDPYLILEDADLETAAKLCVTSRLINAGQSCIAAKRFIVVASRIEEFERLFVERMRAARMGDPMDETTEVGPQARHDLRDELHQQVLASIAKGARCLLGGQIPAGPGAFYPPTVLAGVKKGMVAFSEELFGPVASIIPVKNEREAIKVANDSVFGLGAAVFTQDRARGERIATKELNAGCCVVNDFVKSDPRLPFGGIKESGYGRELSHYGIKEFVNIKTVCVR
jgi:succinate-semialdehyde dehydrogenase / glutarate-semialdehyde dehydrogenase